ncbi:hypothetical protein GCM10009609_43790 [Pseudonocardia aurantiaca]
MRWPRESWLRAFPELSGLLASLPEQMNRAEAAAVAARTRDEHSAVGAFIAAMIWGYGPIGYGPFRARRVVDQNPDAPVRLLACAETARNEGPLAAFRCLADRPLRFLGPAFGTKYLYFCTRAVADRHDGRTAPVLDSAVREWFAAQTNVQLSDSWSVPEYARYLDVLQSWATELDLAMDVVEGVIFRAQIAQQGNAIWAEPWAIAAAEAAEVSVARRPAPAAVEAVKEPGAGAGPHPHVFVVPGDLTHLASDAWLLPTDKTFDVRPWWRPSVPDLDERITALGAAADDFRMEKSRALVLPDWPVTSPQPVLVAVPYGGVTEAEEIAVPLTEALRAAAVAARTRVGLRVPTARRALPLVALPLFGSSGGGGDQFRGQLIQQILDIAGLVSCEERVDVALVLREAPDLAQAHAIRRASPQAWRELDEELVIRARALAQHARAGRLVPFIGAGVSATAGLPLWSDLVAALADGRLPADERRDFERLDVLDQAHVLRHLHPDRAAFERAVADRTRAERYGLAPALLAGLPIREAVTLNYDELYETAASDIGRRPAVLPEETVGPDGRWLLKLHGTVARPETIVLTREDYLGYGRGREALSALAKAMLLTRHLLFVGFGLVDDHFHELMHDVREVLPPADRRGNTLGTAVMLSSSALQKRMWGRDLKLVAVGGEDVSHQARRLEIVLDCLLAYADQGLSFFLDGRYRHRLTAPEQRLRERLLDLAAEAGADERDTPAWTEVEALLRSLGRRE